MLRLITWNVNGIRAVSKKGFFDFLDTHTPDIIGLQEIKARPEQFEQHDALSARGYRFCFWNPAERPGYSGTAVFSKKEPISVSYGIGIPEHDTEGRVTTLEFEDFFFITVYTPNAQDGLARLPYRLTWDRDFLLFCKNLETKKPVIFCGDLNAAHTEIDLANPRSNRGNPGFSDEERAGISNMIRADFLDTYRFFYPDRKGAYTWWSYFGQARAKNVGWRIDYFMASKALQNRLRHTEILPDVLGSDHCPVVLEMT